MPIVIDFLFHLFIFFMIINYTDTRYDFDIFFHNIR